jgi:hypothetical protein
MRSAHSPPHQARSSGVAKHHNEAPGSTSSKPAECASEEESARVRLAALRRAILRYAQANGRSRARQGTTEGAIVTVARRDQPAGHTRFISRSAPAGSARCWSTDACTTSTCRQRCRAHKGRRPRTGRSDRRRRCDASSVTSAETSMPSTRPGDPPADVSGDRARPAPRSSTLLDVRRGAGRRPSCRRCATVRPRAFGDRRVVIGSSSPATEAISVVKSR